MNCPACGSPLKSHTSPKGQPFLTCSRWPRCRISGTPELMERIAASEELIRRTPIQQPEPVHVGEFITKVAQMRIHQSKLRKARTAEERNTIRKQALEALKCG